MAFPNNHQINKVVPFVVECLIFKIIRFPFLFLLILKSQIVDYVTGVERMWLTSAEFEEQGKAERLNHTS